MLIFNHHFFFEDNSALSTSVKEEDKSIHVSAQDYHRLSTLFTLQSPWLEMTGRRVRYYSNMPFEQMNPLCHTWGLEIEEVVTLIWISGTNTIEYIKGKHYSDTLLQFWIFHTFFPLVLTLQRKHTLLHVGGVLLNQKALLFSAFSYGGKSTLIDYFLNKGHAILCDDTVAIHQGKQGYTAIASYPFYRPYRELETLGCPIENFVQSPKPLQAIYCLEKAPKDATVSISELYGIEKFKALHHGSFVQFDFLKKENFALIGELAKVISVYKIQIPWDKKRLEEVYQAIVTHNSV